MNTDRRTGRQSHYETRLKPRAYVLYN